MEAGLGRIKDKAFHIEPRSPFTTMIGKGPNNIFGTIISKTMIFSGVYKVHNNETSRYNYLTVAPHPPLA